MTRAQSLAVKTSRKHLRRNGYKKEVMTLDLEEVVEEGEGDEEKTVNTNLDIKTNINDG
jgi:hypothetical protein